MLTACLASLLCVGGCGGYSAAEHRVESTTALQTLEQVLRSWQQGETPDSWQEHQPPVVVQDLEWKAGKKLESFDIVEPGEAIDANLVCQVKLRLAGSPNREQTVTYLVGTSPVLTVFRSPGPPAATASPR